MSQLEQSLAFEEITEDDISELTGVMTRAFDDDAQKHLGQERGGPEGYDNGDFFWAARAYWILEVLGHHNVGILKYAYGSYLEKNLPISTEDTVVKAKTFVPRVDNEQIQTKLSTLLAIGKKTIIDGRANDHYLGKESIAKRFGHIPTAKNYACTNNYQVTDEGARMKDFDELAKIYEGVPKDKEIIL